MHSKWLKLKNEMFQKVKKIKESVFLNQIDNFIVYNKSYLYKENTPQSAIDLNFTSTPEI